MNQLDLGVQKTFNAGAVGLQVQFDLFNGLNSDTHYAERSANFGTAAYGIPSTIIRGECRYGVTTKPLARRTLRVSLGRSVG